MDEILSRIWENIVGRSDGGPLFLRFIIQPAIATLLGVRAGLADGRALRTPYIMTLLREPSLRPNLSRSGLKDVGKVFVLAMLFDCVYQFMVLRWIYPGEALIVAVTLAILPYALIRGIVDRVVRWRSRPAPQK